MEKSSLFDEHIAESNTNDLLENNVDSVFEDNASDDIIANFLNTLFKETHNPSGKIKKYISSIETKGSQTFSYKAYEKILVRIKEMKNIYHIEIFCSDNNKSISPLNYPNSTITKMPNENSGFLDIKLENKDLYGVFEILKIYKDLLENSLGYLYSNIKANFGCCSHYVECSDQRKCLFENDDFYLRCSYRKNLENNRIFYGKNKNS